MPRVLLIEDDFTMLSLLNTLLQIEGFETFNPADDRPDTILQAIRQYKPDVTLLDVNLHQCCGTDLMQTIRNDPELKDQRVIMSSGLDLRYECRQAGANSFLLKPYMPDDLIKLIKLIIGNENSG